MLERRPKSRIELPGLSDAFRTDSGRRPSAYNYFAGGARTIP